MATVKVNGVETQSRYDPTDEQKKKAQEYANAMLTGKGQSNYGYLSPGQAVNAVTNASNPIKTSGGGSSSQDTAVSAYLAELERQRAERQALLDSQYNKGKQNIEDSAAASNKEAYISYMNGMKNMPQAAAMYGSGGMAQSLANKSQLNYENNRNNINAAKLSSLSDLEADYNSGVLSAGDDYLTKLASAQSKISSGSSTKQLTGVSDNGKTYNSLAAWIASMKNKGLSDEEITNLANSSGLSR